VRELLVSIGLLWPGGRLAPGALGTARLGTRGAKYPVVVTGEAEMLPPVVVENVDVYVP
jgi:hypothetical protein